jgi:HD-GYP domain-containing protein (c-di-GMP phosphodiesterase class II)
MDIASNLHLEDALRDTVTVLSAAIEAKDEYTGDHVRRVAAFSTAIARRLRLDGEELREVALAALLHDVGKVWVDDNVLGKSGRLTDDEWAEMKRHPQFGWGALVGEHKERSDGGATKNMWKRIANGLLLHHERPDGHGYPFGLRGEEIPLLARIIAVADTFDAMTSDRPYRKALSAQTAYDEILRCRGTQFCEKVVDAFAQAFTMEGWGSLD